MKKLFTLLLLVLAVSIVSCSSEQSNIKPIKAKLTFNSTTITLLADTLYKKGDTITVTDNNISNWKISNLMLNKDQHYFSGGSNNYYKAVIQ